MVSLDENRIAQRILSWGPSDGMACIALSKVEGSNYCLGNLRIALE